MEKITLCIYTLGRFYVRRGQEIITAGGKRAKKRWNLFQILFTYLDQRLTLNKMIYYLNLNINSNPGEALKSLIYYLRKDLRENQSEEDRYILNQGGLYCFNQNSNYWLDAEEFEDLCCRARYMADKDPKRALKMYKKAIELYKGDYLLEAGSETWVLPVRAHYRNIFLHALIESSHILQKTGNLDEVVDLCEKGLRINPFEEQLHEMILKSLIEMGYLGEARLRYDETESFFSENDLDLSSRIKKIGDFLSSSRRTSLPNDPEKIFSDLLNRHKNDSPLVCNRDTFLDLYSLEKARNDRNNNRLFLLSFKIKNNIDTPEEIKSAAIFEDILVDVLRKCDVVCRWDEDSYFALLTDVESDFKPEYITERIEREIQQHNIDKLLEIDTEFLLTSDVG